jgi:3-phenylpropionate/trans-cinnamate dioxygenase ferredoxin subunit
MVAALEVAAEERIPLAFVLAVEIGRLRRGTREHQEIGQGLREVYDGVMDAPEGPVMLQFANDELYIVGVRIRADSSELEEYWLDNRSALRAINERAEPPDENFARAIERFFPEVISQPDEWHFDSVRSYFLELSRKIDTSLREYAPAVRAIYNKERKEIIKRTIEMQASRARSRSRRYPRRPDGEIWRPAIRVDQAGPGDMVEVEIEGRRILVANTGEDYYAIDAVCTHVPSLGIIASMEKGRLDIANKCVECPWHGSQFDLQTGRVVRPPYHPAFNRQHFFAGRLTSVLDPKKTASDTRVYPAKIVGEYVMVNIA